MRNARRGVQLSRSAAPATESFTERLRGSAQCASADPGIRCLLPETGGVGVDDGTRTHDDRIHNPGLYQLSYVHQISIFRAPGLHPGVARPAGLEPATLGLAYHLCFRSLRLAEFVVWTISSPSQVPHV